MTTPAPLPYQRMLRIIGGALDAAGSSVAVIHATPTGARVHADAAAVPEEWSAAALDAEAQRQEQQRGADTVPWTRRLGWQLRLVGAALDLEGPGPYTLLARPEEIFVFNAHGYQRAFRHTALERRAALAPEYRGQATTCPVCDGTESLVPLVAHLPDEAVLGGRAARGEAVPTHRCRLCGASVHLAAPPG
jgi:hypothetical protein